MPPFTETRLKNERGAICHRLQKRVSKVKGVGALGCHRLQKRVSKMRGCGRNNLAGGRPCGRNDLAGGGHVAVTTWPWAAMWP